MNAYLTAIGLMPKLFELSLEPLKTFSRQKYKPGFEAFYQEILPALDAIETLYSQVAEPEEMLSNMAAELVKTPAEQVAACPKKAKREQLLMNYNLQLAAFVYPAILQYKGKSSEPFAKMVGAKWKEAFPASRVQAATYEQIESGFHKKFCYITTAVCQSRGLPDDCEELTLLRDYRDHYLKGLPEGEALIRKYYDIAPTIVKHINEREDAQRIYEQINLDYIRPCIGMIRRGELEACREHYRKMTDTLADRYFAATAPKASLHDRPV